MTGAEESAVIIREAIDRLAPRFPLTVAFEEIPPVVWDEMPGRLVGAGVKAETVGRHIIEYRREESS